MANATVLSIGGVTVSTTGGLTGNLLQQVINSFGANDSLVSTTTVAGGLNNPTIPAPPGGSLPAVLVIPSTDTGTISIPAGYAYVVYSGTGSLTGGSANTTIVGSGLNYSGPAAEVLGTGRTENVTDSMGGATFAFFDGKFALNAGGSGDTVNVDNGASGQITVSGSNDHLNIGTASGSSTPTAAIAAAASVVSPGSYIITGSGESLSIASGTSLFDIQGTGSVPASAAVSASGGTSTFILGTNGILTLSATGGSQLVYGNALGADVIMGGPSTEFVGFAGAPESTFTSSAGGADTVFAGSTIDYNGTAAASTFYFGGNGPATVIAGSSSTLFGGTGGGSYTAGSTGMFFWNTTGGATDSILGGTASGTVTAYGSNNENLVVSQLGAASGGTYVAFGQSDTINAMDARGGNTFYIVDQTLTIGGTAVNFSGNTTLVGSDAGHDLFAMFDFGNTTAHTVTIENWQASDSLFMGGYSAADAAAATAALAAAGGSNASFSLSDGTTVKFIGVSPTSHS